MLHIYTYSTSPEKANYLFKSAEFHGVKITNLSKTNIFVDFKQRLQAMKEEFERLPSNDIVCFIDAYDVIVNSGEKEMLERFLASGCDLLYGAETNLFPDSIPRESYPESHTPFRFLNAGCYIGYVHAVCKMLSWGSYTTNDQEYANLYFLEKNKEHNVKLDKDSKFVLNMTGVPWNALILQNGLSYFTQTKNAPCFLHFNGMSFMDIQKDYILHENKLLFDYHKVYDTTFAALLNAKKLSKEHPIVCQLTGKGSTYA
jgi:hypothetical protein